MKTFTLELLTVALVAYAHPAQAQTYPSKAVKFIVPFATGGASDSLARVVGQKLSERLGQPVIVENRPGAGGVLAADFVAKAAPDGYTLLIGDIGANAIAASLFPKLPYDPLKDFAPINLAINLPIVLIVHPSVKATNLNEILAIARADPGKLNYASAGNGGISHLAGEMLRDMAGINITHVPYKGGAPGLADTIGGATQMMFVSVPTAQPHLRAGKVRAIAVTGSRRAQALPDIPTMAEAGLPGYSSDSWGGMLAPAKTPREIVERLDREISEVLRIPETRERLTQMGFEIVGAGPAEFQKFLQSEVAKWAKVVRSAGVKPE